MSILRNEGDDIPEIPSKEKELARARAIGLLWELSDQATNSKVKEVLDNAGVDIEKRSTAKDKKIKSS